LKNSGFLDETGPVSKEEIDIAYLIKQCSKIRRFHVQLYEALQAIENLLIRLESIPSTVEILLSEAGKTRGIDYAFHSPAWTTWPFSRFLDEVTLLTAPYRPSLQLLQTLFEAITSSSIPYPLPNISPTPLPDLPRPSSDTDPKLVSFAERQAALSYWACMPLLKDRDEIGGERWWEEICEVEVSGWKP